MMDNWMLIAVALGSAGMLAWPVISSGARPGSQSTQKPARSVVAVALPVVSTSSTVDASATPLADER